MEYIIGLLLLGAIGWGAFQAVERVNDKSMSEYGVQTITNSSMTIVGLATVALALTSYALLVPAAMISLAVILCMFVWTVDRTSLGMGLQSVLVQIMLVAAVIIAVFLVLAWIGSQSQKKQARRRR